MDIESLLKSLNAHSVEYVLIGATAFPVHGYARATLDIDAFIRATPENARRTHQALAAFGYDLSSVTEEELLTHKILIRQYLVEPATRTPRSGTPISRNPARPEEQLSALVAIRRDVEVVEASRADRLAIKARIDHPRHREDARVLRKVLDRRRARE